MTAFDFLKRASNGPEWSDEAKEALSRVPFFVRKRVKARVEEEAARRGDRRVTMTHVDYCRQRFLNNMESEVNGYQIETCFGSGGCPNRVPLGGDLVKGIEAILGSQELRAFLKERVVGPLKLHHEFRVTIADCPNACSRPQIADIGIIAARRPRLSEAPCTKCGSCAETCTEEAISLDEATEVPIIEETKCVACGLCIAACPSGTLAVGLEGRRIMMGGKLGRHPQLARELPGIYSDDEVLKIVADAVDHYKRHNRHGERFGEVLNRVAFPAQR
jgi:anaerobic sulfite reductase subunit C